MSERFYCWVRVGDGDPEPAVVEGEKPKRKATTLGALGARPAVVMVDGM